MALLVIAGCGGPAVVGKWNYSLLGQDMQLNLKEDKTFTMGSTSTSVQAGTYTVEDNKVLLVFGSLENQPVTLNMADDGKSLDGSVLGVNLTFTRAE